MVSGVDWKLDCLLRNAPDWVVSEVAVPGALSTDWFLRNAVLSLWHGLGLSEVPWVLVKSCHHVDKVEDAELETLDLFSHACISGKMSKRLDGYSDSIKMTLR